jgi:hypothetical protein
MADGKRQIFCRHAHIDGQARSRNTQRRRNLSNALAVRDVLAGHILAD